MGNYICKNCGKVVGEMYRYCHFCGAQHTISYVDEENMYRIVAKIDIEDETDYETSTIHGSIVLVQRDLITNKFDTKVYGYCDDYLHDSWVKDKEFKINDEIMNCERHDFGIGGSVFEINISRDYGREIFNNVRNFLKIDFTANYILIKITSSEAREIQYRPYNITGILALDNFLVNKCGYSVSQFSKKNMEDIRDVFKLWIDKIEDNLKTLENTIDEYCKDNPTYGLLREVE